MNRIQLNFVTIGSDTFHLFRAFAAADASERHPSSVFYHFYAMLLIQDPAYENQSRRVLLFSM